MSGNEADCSYSCRCKNANEVCDQETGACQSGCRDENASDIGVDRQGPGCRIGREILSLYSILSRFLTFYFIIKKILIYIDNFVSSIILYKVFTEFNLSCNNINMQQ